MARAKPNKSRHLTCTFDKASLYAGIALLPLATACVLACAVMCVPATNALRGGSALFEVGSRATVSDRAREIVSQEDFTSDPPGPEVRVRAARFPLAPTAAALRLEVVQHLVRISPAVETRSELSTPLLPRVAAPRPPPARA